LRYLKLFRLIAKTPERADFLETYYTLMRYVDDIVDNDAPLPAGYTDAEQYLLDKIKFAGNPVGPADDVDALMLHCFQLGKSFGESFGEETEAILGSLLFDTRRMGKRRVFSHLELMAHYHLLDIAGTVRATVKLFDEDAEKYLLLEPLGMASRFFYDLRDFRDDIQKGLINISAEDMAAFHISQEDLDDAQSLPVQRWFRAQALRGMALLGQHQKNVAVGGFRRSTRWTFRLVYAGPARRFFIKVLKATENLEAFSLPAFPSAAELNLEPII
jgi:phytoene/squalene synthetase